MCVTGVTTYVYDFISVYLDDSCFKKSVTFSPVTIISAAECDCSEQNSFQHLLERLNLISSQWQE